MNTEKHICEICGVREARYYLPLLKIWCCKDRKDSCKGPPKPGVCIVCGKHHNGEYGTGQFCSRKCACRHNLTIGRKSEKFKEHLGDLSWRGTHQKFIQNNKWECNICHTTFEFRKELREHNKKFHPEKIKMSVGGAWRKGHHKDEPGFEWLKKAGEKLSKRLHNGELKPSFLGKHHSKETRELISKRRIEYLLNNESLGRRPDVKWYECPNINGESYKHQGTWELQIAKWLNEHNILWVKRKLVQYQTDDGVNKMYIPDFYLPVTNQYIETKGMFPEADKIKMRNVLMSNPGIEIFFIHGKKCLSRVLAGSELPADLLYKI